MSPEREQNTRDGERGLDTGGPGVQAGSTDDGPAKTPESPVTGDASIFPGHGSDSTCSWVFYDEQGNEAERCETPADSKLSFTSDHGDEVLVPFCSFHAAVVDGVIL